MKIFLTGIYSLTRRLIATSPAAWASSPEGGRGSRTGQKRGLWCTVAFADGLRFGEAVARFLEKDGYNTVVHVAAAPRDLHTPNGA